MRKSGVEEVEADDSPLDAFGQRAARAFVFDVFEQVFQHQQFPFAGQVVERARPLRFKNFLFGDPLEVFHSSTL